MSAAHGGRTSRRAFMRATLGASALAMAARPASSQTGSNASDGAQLGSASASFPGARRVMWGAALMAHPLEARLEAVAGSGFTHMTVFPADMKRWRRSGLTDAAIRRAIEASGVSVATLDPYTGWSPGWSLEGLDKFTREFIDVSEDDVWRMTDALGTDQVNCVESAGAAYSQEPYADALGAFAERARAKGLRTTFEFMPTSKVADIHAGWGLVEASGPLVGLTFDTWHFWRSDPDHGALRAIPIDRIAEVQVADGGATIVEDLQTDLLYHRRVPGEGAFDLRRTLAVLAEMGPVRSIGPETFSAQMNELSAREAVRRNEKGLGNVLA